MGVDYFSVATVRCFLCPRILRRACRQCLHASARPESLEGPGYGCSRCKRVQQWVMNWVVQGFRRKIFQFFEVVDVWSGLSVKSSAPRQKGPDISVMLYLEGGKKCCSCPNVVPVQSHVWYFCKRTTPVILSEMGTRPYVCCVVKSSKYL